jgi:cytochrome c553
MHSMEDEVRRIVGVALSDAEAQALAAWYASLARNVAAFPAEALKQTEPPLRSVPGPVL